MEKKFILPHKKFKYLKFPISYNQSVSMIQVNVWGWGHFSMVKKSTGTVDSDSETQVVSQRLGLFLILEAAAPWAIASLSGYLQ